jgi:ADP-dependent NAD(P)H-hydrate dehydratase / NAD(P)H-hydrate epimerase
MLHRILTSHPYSTNALLFDANNTRIREAAAARSLPKHALMQRAGTTVCDWSTALYPHAQHIWVACGPGNNGGDGLVAALALHRRLHPWGGSVWISWCGNQDHLPDDARQAMAACQAEGLLVHTHPPAHFDLAIDAVFGLGRRRQSGSHSPYGMWLEHLHAAPQPVLAVDLPSQLDADSGHSLCETLPGGPRHTLALLTLKPGLFTGQGRNLAGDVWFDDLQRLGDASFTDEAVPCADLFFEVEGTVASRHRVHNTHKGRHGDLWVLGGEDVTLAADATTTQAMTGAALLAARAALHTGAGRVLVGLLNTTSKHPLRTDPVYPDLIFQNPTELNNPAKRSPTVVVCGCGGGQSVHTVLPSLLNNTAALVLDADALNAIAADPQRYQPALRKRRARGLTTVLTPHPLEAARLLDLPLEEVNNDRLAAAQALADRFQCTVVLKGSGTVTAHPLHRPAVNPTGNGLLGIAGTGDVLAGMVGGFLCRLAPSGGSTSVDEHLVHKRVALAVYTHGLIADRWPPGTGLVASQMPTKIPPP